MTTMSKLFSKTVKKTALWSVIIAIVLAAAIVVCALFGFNQNIAMKDRKALTVSLDSYTYNTQLDDIKGDLVGELGAEYVLEGTMSGLTSEVVFVFEMDADLEALKTKAESYLATKLATSGANYNVSTSTEEATVALAKGFVLRAAIAGVVLAVLAFVYVSLRYNLASGIVTGVSALLGMLLAASVIVLARVYVTSSVAYAITLGGLLATAMTLFTLNNVRAAEKEGAEETVADCVAVKEVLYTAVVVAVGMIAVGVLGKSNGIWFAVSALVSVAAAAFVALFFAPACYLSLKTAFNNKPAKGGYVGAKKTSTKEKKAPAVKVVEEAPVEEAPAEEVVEEAPAEEVPAEEVVEEAPVEEVPAEETTEE
jgi:preprotein translocase subunit SecF